MTFRNMPIPLARGLEDAIRPHAGTFLGERVGGSAIRRGANARNSTRILPGNSLNPHAANQSRFLFSIPRKKFEAMVFFRSDLKAPEQVPEPARVPGKAAGA
jgi:hypothetical protein